MNFGLQQEIPYGSDQHRRILQAVRTRVDASKRKMAPLLERWKNSENLFMAYVKTSEEEEKRKKKREEGQPQYSTISIPYSYATALTAHTYWTSVFLSRSPVMQFAGRHGEGEQKIMCIEAYVDYQIQVGEMLPVLYHWLLDPLRYGYGVIGNYWCEETRYATEIVEEPMMVLGVPIPGTERKKKRISIIPGYHGNKIFNVRPHDFFYDPRVSLVNFQKGEYAGRWINMGWNEVVRKAKEGYYFNTDQLTRASQRFYQDREISSDQITLSGEPGDFEYGADEYSKGRHPANVEGIEMVQEIIPSDYGLGKNDRPEKWVFTVAYGSVVIGCQPLGAYHDKFPYFIQSYEFDPYTFSPRGMMEILQPLNYVMDWLFNSHMFNVRKALNDSWVVDPSRITMADLKSNEPGKLIRISPAAYGTDVRMAVTQYPVMDVTSQHLQAMEVIQTIVQRVTGVTDNVMGLVGQGGRKTATEVRSSNTMGINRLKTMTEYNSALGWTPLASVLVQNSQQYYDQEQMFRIVGDLALMAPQFDLVTPESISGFFDLVPVDGTLPVDRFAQANLWKEILMGLAKFPPLGAQYDLGKIFAWMAQLAGLKNIHQFKLPMGQQMQVLPDQQIEREAQAGNMIPGGAPEMQGVLPPGGIQ